VQVTPILDAADSPLGSKVIFTDVTRQRELQDELQRSRQELETTNEELQSTNEELETMNEELQSTNEELETVNEELRQRGTDLSRSNIFLGGILRSVPLAVIVGDEQLQVELWNDVADLWGLRAQIDAINRRGRQIRLHVQCVSIGSGDQGKGVIILMQELGTRATPTRH
jgi:two-component system, chemotaxis family, CheB/CheR fusion protein